MRVFLPVLVVGCVAAGIFTFAQTRGDATTVLAATREALGGDQKLAAVKTFVATGPHPPDSRQQPGADRIRDRVRVAGQVRAARRDSRAGKRARPPRGFNGEALIQVPPPPEPSAQGAVGARRQAGRPTAASPTAGRPAVATAANATPPGANAATTPAALADPPKPPAPPPDPRKARVMSLKQDFVRLTLGMFAASFSGYPLTFTLVGQAEAPQGKADIIDVKDAGTFTLQFFVNSETHLPIMVSWTTPATNVVLLAPGMQAPDKLPPGSINVEAPAPPAPTAPKEEKDKYAKDIQDLRKKALAGAKPVEHRIYYADYRDVGNGLKFPFRLRRAVAGETIEETNFDTFKINARIDPRKFEVVK